MKIKPDYLNALFEFGGAMFLLLNIFRLYRDKILRGVRILPTAFFALWGFWNLYYYPFLGQWWSFTAGLSVVVVNTTWVAMAVYYWRKEIKCR